MSPYASLTTEFRTEGWIPWNWGSVEVFVSLHGCCELILDSLQEHYVLIPAEPSIPTSHILCLALPGNMYECHIHSNLNISHVIVIALSPVLCHEGRGLFFFSHFLITRANCWKTQLSYQKASTKSPSHPQKISVNFVSREDAMITILYTIYHPPPHTPWHVHTTICTTIRGCQRTACWSWFFSSQIGT